MSKYLHILVFLCLCNVLNAQEDLVLRTAQSLRNNVVRISVSFPDGGKEDGFGFITGEKNGQLYLATAGHVIFEKGNESRLTPTLIQIYFYSEKKAYTAEPIQFFEEDLYLLQMNKPPDFKYRSDNWADFYPQNNQTVRFIGREKDWLIPGQGEVYKVENDQIIATMSTVRPGTSGAPLINAKGVIGLIIEDDNNEVTAVALGKIRELFSKGGQYPYFNLVGERPIEQDKPKSPPVSNLNARLDLQNLNNAKRKGTREAYLDYINQYPQGSYVNLARDSIQAIDARVEAKRQNDAKMKQEQVDWDIATSLNSFESYQEYLIKHPDGNNIAEAKKRKDALQPSPDIPANNMVKVEAGSFTMGCIESRDGTCNNDETPSHRVTLTSFYLSKYEVTVAQFKIFVEATKYQTDAEKKGYSHFWTGSTYQTKTGLNWRSDVTGSIRSLSEYNHPVIHVSRNDAIAYCQWLSQQTGKTYRLPTEAEWEYAARGGKLSKGYKYAGSNEIKDVAWCERNSKNTTHKVGELTTNELGLCDMSGNVWEWCADWYDGSYYKTSPQTNPLGPDSSSSAVLRGGSWDYYGHISSIADRHNYNSGNSNNALGFRIARNL